MRVVASSAPSSSDAPKERRYRRRSDSASLSLYSQRRLTEDDLFGKSAWELDVMRNEPFARHGYRFKRADLRNHFSQFSWYEPDTSSQSRVAQRLSPTEQYNAEVIRKYQQQSGTVSRHLEE